MTNKEFFMNVTEFREKAHDLREGNGNFNIKRGMAHGMSGYVEDLFALFIAKKNNRHDLQYLIDKVTSIRLNESEKAKSFKPDVSIIENEIMTHYFDLKTNMGWNRAFEPYLQEKDKFIKSLRGKTAWINHSKNNIQEIHISHNLIYQMVVVYGWNINQGILNSTLDLVKGLEHVKVHILFHGDNENGINDQAFTDIFKTFES